MSSAAVQHTLISQLREHLAHRRIESGFRTLEGHRADLGSIHPGAPGSAVLLGYLAQWVDVGFACPGLVQELLARFPGDLRLHLPLIDYLHLRVAEGYLAMSHEEFDAAMDHLEFVESVEEEIRDNELIAVANFWIGRCLRREGKYDDALAYITKARDMAFALGYPRMAAIMQITESWLLFQKGRIADASRILEVAASALADTDDYVARGNIESAYGRIARRQGRYDRAIAHFERANEEYRRRNPDHPNLARSLVNFAFVKRLIGVQLQKRLDTQAAHRTGAKFRDAGNGFAHERDRLQVLRSEAHAALDRAGAIYSRLDQHRGRGTVHVNRALLLLDSGELERAGDEAATAFQLGEEKRDFILMARARVVQCMVESTRFEEQIEDDFDPHYHAQKAHDYAREALDFARRTQNRRLLARANIWHGLVLANEFFNNVDAARECCDTAVALLRPDGQDYLWDDLQQLKGMILRRGRIDVVLREWSQGLIGEKTFQQVSEEFAAIVIPRVWEREGRKVSRVAEKLSVSPKKVRRILQTAGLLDVKPHSPAPQSSDVVQHK